MFRFSVKFKWIENLRNISVLGSLFRSLPIEHWHEWIGDATIADAMLDRLMQNNHRFKLSGESMRKNTPAKTKASTTAIKSEGS